MSDRSQPTPDERSLRTSEKKQPVVRSRHLVLPHEPHGIEKDRRGLAHQELRNVSRERLVETREDEGECNGMVKKVWDDWGEKASFLERKQRPITAWVISRDLHSGCSPASRSVNKKSEKQELEGSSKSCGGEHRAFSPVIK